MHNYYDSISLGSILPLLLLFGLAFIPASMAGKKGYSYGGFYVFGIFAFLIAVIVAACLEDRNMYIRRDEVKFRTSANADYIPKYVPTYGIKTDGEPCHSCGEIISKEDRFCGNCGAKNLNNQARID